MPTFCRHNRFIERCPICSKTLPGAPAGGRPHRPARAARPGGAGPASGTRRPRGEGLLVKREGRAGDDGYRCDLAAGLRASADAGRLAEEIAFAAGRLLALAADPPGLYGEARALAARDLEEATWTCFSIAYLCPLEGEDPFAGIRAALAGGIRWPPAPGGLERLDETVAAADLGELPLGPRSSHARDRGGETLRAYIAWAQRSGGSQAAAFTGDPGWTPERRFERLFERLSLPGLGRAGRYELLVVLGRLGLYELRPDSLHLGGARGVPADDATTLAAKRVFGIGDTLLLERRAATLAAEAAVPVEALDLALSNWAAGQRATLGFAPGTSDEGALARARHALSL